MRGITSLLRFGHMAHRAQASPCWKSDVVEVVLKYVLPQRQLYPTISSANHVGHTTGDS